jgi:hypothetical protein
VSARRHACLAAAVIACLAAGCGGSGSGDDASPEAQEVVEELEAMKAGEILIKGSSPRVYGPYELERGGYVLSYQQPASTDLVVALESKPRSRVKPYELLVDSDDRTGTRPVTLTGKLYVHVVAADGEYELRLTPRG